jgi:hypothetical protein
MSSPDSPDHSTTSQEPDDLRQRVEQALRELPLSKADIAIVAPQLVGFYLHSPHHGQYKPDSSFFDFHRNVTDVVKHFRRHGLTLEEYLRAAVKEPQLFTENPATVIANIEGVFKHFRADGVRLKDYLRAGLDRPVLFTEDPATLIANTEAVVEYFRADGPTLHGYLSATDGPLAGAIWWSRLTKQDKGRGGRGR